VSAENPAGTPTPFEPWVYAWPQSVRSGEAVALHAAGPAGEADLEIARVGAERQVVHASRLRLTPHEVPPDANEAGCGWPAAATVEVPADWRSGYYEVVLRTTVGTWHESVGFFVVRPVEARAERPLLVLSTNTWNAYNDWGGPNLYDGGFTWPQAAHAVSFARPMARGILRKPAGPGMRVAVLDPPDPTMSHHVRYVLEHGLTEWAGSAGWPSWELPFVTWAERNGYELDVAVDADLERVPDLLDGRRLVLSVGHDEYWTWGMRDAVEGFARSGGNVAFLSGNTSFWQVRLEDEGRTMVGYKAHFEQDPVYGTDRQHLLTSIWSDPLVGRPETQMTGVTFARGGYARIGRNVGRGSGGYTVHRPEHWLFDGTGLGWGDQLGTDAVVVAYECDGCELTLVDGRPTPTGAGGTPPDFQVLATSPCAPFDRDNELRATPEGMLSEIEFNAWRLLGSAEAADVDRLRYGHAVLGVHEPGGTVVTAGCTDWAWGLERGDAAVEQITRNLLDRLTSR
jgi:hypothetical protein